MLRTECLGPMTLAEVAALVGGTLEGPADLSIHGVRGLDEATPDDLSFLEDARLAERAAGTRAAAVLVPNGVQLGGRPCISVKKPKLAWAQVLGRLYPARRPPGGVHPTAVVGRHVHLAPGAVVGPCCVVGDDVTLGADTWLVSHVTVGERTTVGRDSTLFPHTSVGADTRLADGVRLHPWTTIGDRVHLEASVEIGARCSLGADSHVGEGTKIDNMVPMGHHVQIGAHTILVSYSAFESCSRIGSHCLIAGQVWVQEGMEVGDRCILAGRARITRPVPSRSFISGDDNRPHKEELRLFAYVQQLPDILRRYKPV